MFKKVITMSVLVTAALLTGCASVPMDSKEREAFTKTFPTPPAGKAGLYIYRDSFAARAVHRNVLIDGVLIGSTADKVYFYQVISPGPHKLITQATNLGTSDSTTFQAEAGHNYFAEQNPGSNKFLLVGWTSIEMVDEETGKKEVMKCGLAK